MAETATVLRFISDPGHGWVEVPADLLEKLRMGTDFPRRGDMCYLEEDEECYRLDISLKKHKELQATFAYHEVDDFELWLGGQQWPYIPAGGYGDDITLVVAALESHATQMKQLSNDKTYSAEERAAWAQAFDDCQRLALLFSTMKGERDG